VAVGVEVGPQVVDGVQEGAAGDLGGAARDVVDVVVLEGDVVGGSGEVESPVVVAVAGGRVVDVAVNLAVGDGNAATSLSTKDNVLTADLGSLSSC
jgi:hypothetical protein